MILENFQTLIQNLPVRQQSFTTRRDYQVWQTAENIFEWYRPLNNTFFGNELTLKISRQNLFSINDTRELILKTIYWGYPRGGNIRHHFSDILQNIQALENTLNEIKNIPNPTTTDFDRIENSFSEIQGLGLSTYSKLLYFSKIKFNGHCCQILDTRLIEIFSNGIFDDFSAFRQIRYDNAKNYYIRYIETINQIAERLQTKGENIEQFLFIFGNNL